MNAPDPLTAGRVHLAGLIEAAERCVYFLNSLVAKVPAPLQAEVLQQRRKDQLLFETLAATNERFAKLQDVLSSAFRHAALLAGEKTDSFLEILAFFEKAGVLSSSQDWQRIRVLRNLASHDYETDYPSVAAHFNSVLAAVPVLFGTAGRFVVWCRMHLEIGPASTDFEADFDRIVNGKAESADAPV